MESNTCCNICVKEFFKVSNLRRHTKKFHPEQFVPLPEKTFPFTCKDCGKNFSYMRNYKCHRKTHDTDFQQGKTSKNCPLCKFFSEEKQLNRHFETAHNIKLVTEHVSFQNFDDFMKWKMLLENSGTSFTRTYSQKTKCYAEVILFACHRSGHSSSKSKLNKKFGNDVVTKKIGGFCPARIRMMKMKNGSIQASFVKTHVGHDEASIPDVVVNRKLKIIHSRHKKSLNFSTDSLMKSGSTWQFYSQDENETYIISQKNDKCDRDCSYSCESCGSCVHEFSCSCKDWAIKWNMCVHIHLLCRILKDNNEKKQGQDLLSNSNINITDLIIYDAPNNCQQTHLNDFVQDKTSQVSDEDKNAILQEFSNIVLSCRSTSVFQEIVAFVENLKTRLECENILHPLEAKFGGR